jgi:simple sugar transport system substrate-binding protein
MRVAALLLLALLGGCSRDAQERSANGTAERDTTRLKTRIVVVTHGQSSDPFWSVVANGTRDAARDMGVRVEYQAPARFDMVEMSNLIDAAIASQPTGLIVSIPDPAALTTSIRAAVQRGIPVISINSGSDAYQALGVLAHIGQTEYEAALRAGEQLAAAGVTRALCVNHEVGNVALDRRCDGLRDALARLGGTSRTLAVNLADPDDTQQRLASALASDAAIDGILALGIPVAEPTLAAVRASERAEDINVATFDLSPAVLAAVRDGAILFAIDQQQYLQGYLAIVLLTKYLETGAVPGGGQVLLTGPGFVTRENAASVIAHSARGVR